MGFSTSKHDQTIVVTIHGKLGLENHQALRRLMLDELERGERRFRLDFRYTDAVDSSGLGVLVSLVRRIREQRGELRLSNLSTELRTLFELTRLSALFDIDEDGPGPGGGASAAVPPRPDATGTADRQRP